MRWCLAAWDEISAASIQNCFSFTGLFDIDLQPGNSEQVQIELDELQNDVAETIRNLPIRDGDRMSAEEIAALPAENEYVFYEMTDEEIISSANNIDDEMEDEQKEAELQLPSYSMKKKLESIAVVLSLLNVADPTDLVVHNHLRTLQRGFRMNEGKQTTLDQWFRPSSNNQ